MKLTHENYFSKPANQFYMSFSQFKTFEECESKAMAEISGVYKTEKAVFKEGHYFESLVAGTSEQFKKDNPDILKKDGSLYANFEKINMLYLAFEKQPLFMNVVKHAEQQKIFTTTINGVPFKSCVDFYVKDVGVYDTKAMKDFKRIYSEKDGRYLEWYFARGYHFQTAIYKKATQLPQHIMAVTKEKEPDVVALKFNDLILNNALEIVSEFAPKYQQIKEGKVKPTPCNKCEYCKQTKILTEWDEVFNYE